MLKRAYNYIGRYLRFHNQKYINFIFFITNRCNLSCEHCFYSKQLNKPLEELSLEEIDLTFKSLNSKCKSVILTGGEPFIRNDLFEICKILSENGIKYVTIPSNGLDTEKIYNTVGRILKELNLHLTVQLSLDGLEKTHDKIRVHKGLFKRVVTTAKKLKGLNFDLNLNTSMSKTNYKELEQLAEYVDKNIGITHNFEFVRGVETSGVAPCNSNNFSPKDKTIFLNERELIDVWKILSKIYKRRSNGSLTNLFLNGWQVSTAEYSIKTLLKRKSPAKCTAGDKMGVIYPNGGLAICELMKPVGNIRKNDLNVMKVWDNNYANKQRQFVSKCYCTHGCFIGYPYTIKYQFVLLKNVIKLLF